MNTTGNAPAIRFTTRSAVTSKGPAPLASRMMSSRATVSLTALLRRSTFLLLIILLHWTDNASRDGHFPLRVSRRPAFILAVAGNYLFS